MPTRSSARTSILIPPRCKYYTAAETHIWPARRHSGQPHRLHRRRWLGADCAGRHGGSNCGNNSPPPRQAARRRRPPAWAARDTLRLEAGMPLYGHELNEEIDPFQAGLAFAVDLEERRFPASDVLEARLRDDKPSPPPRRLANGRQTRAARGYAVLAGRRHAGRPGDQRHLLADARTSRSPWATSSRPLPPPARK